MKKTLTLLFALVSISASAQYFKLTVNGFMNANDSTNFVVIPFEGKSQSDIYKRANSFIHSNYIDPDKVLSVIDNEVININAEHKDQIVLKGGMGVKVNATVNFNVVLKFKDGKLRVDAPNINRIYAMPTTSLLEVKFTGSALESMNGTIILFKKNGEVKNEYNVKQIENFFNSYIQLIVDNLSSKKNDDW